MQGTKDTFVFTNIPGHPVIFRPTGTTSSFCVSKKCLSELQSCFENCALGFQAFKKISLK